MQEERKEEKATAICITYKHKHALKILPKEIDNGEEYHDRFMGIAWLSCS